MIMYDEQNINAMGTILQKIKVEGVNQARMLVMLDELLKTGEQKEEEQEQLERKTEEEKEIKPEDQKKKEGKYNGNRKHCRLFEGTGKG